MFRRTTILIMLLIAARLDAQVPSEAEDLMATFGNMSEQCCGDDDFSQTIFLAIPSEGPGNFYIRLFDPDCGGAHDLASGLWETNTVFEMYGGKGCLSEPDARMTSPVGNYRSGVLLERALFARESAVDDTWITFGPFTPEEGEQLSIHPGYSFFKLIVEGQTGNDGNVYGIAISRAPGVNLDIDHAVHFEYERTHLSGSGVLTSREEIGLNAGEEVVLPLELDVLDVNTNPGQVIVEPVKKNQ